MDERAIGGKIGGTVTARNAAATEGGTSAAAAEARVLRRLERIETLDRGRAAAGELLGELRALVREAETWARVEGEARGAERPEVRGEGEE